MKRNMLMLLVALMGLNASAQTFTIVNNSKSQVYFQIFGTDKGSCTNKYSSLTKSIEPGSKTVYGSVSEIQWSGNAPVGAIGFSSFSGMYVDPSGACISKASELIGDAVCKYGSSSTINMSKCGGTGGNLNLSWSSKNGNVSVTIN